MNSKTIKKLLLSLMLIGLVFPLIQAQLSIFELRKLDGSFDKKVRPVFSKENWFKGSFQDSLQDYTEENIGFRNFLVRLNNQMAFWLFNEARAKQVIIGKSNYLFEQNYIDSYFGRDFIGEDAIADKVYKLKFISDQLKNKGIDLMVVITPGKGDFYPEYIPDKYYEGESNQRNYTIYLEELKKKNIPTIDFNAYFKLQKSKSDYPLYTKGGIHWSHYAELLAGDSIISFVEKMKAYGVTELARTGVVSIASGSETITDLI